MLLHKNGILPEGVRALWSSDELTAVARQVLGDDFGHPAKAALRQLTKNNKELKAQALTLGAKWLDGE